MTDLVNRLRRHAEKAVGHWEDYANATGSIVREAADEIEQLRDRAETAVVAANSLRVEVDRYRSINPSPSVNLRVVWTSQYQLDEAQNTGMGYIYAGEWKPEKADIPLMRLAGGGPASSDNLPLFGELPSPSPFTRKAGHTAADLVAKIAQVSTAVGFQASEPAMEMAGQIVSVLAANPEYIDRFMAEGSGLFLDGTLNHENGSLTYRAMNGSILSPSVLREKKGQQQ